MKSDIAKLVSNGFFREALSLYSKLYSSSSILDHKFAFPFLLKASAKLNSPLQGQMLHTHLIKTGFHSDIYSATALADMYMKLHLLSHALKVFEEIPHRNLPSLNVTISGFSQNGYLEEALGAFKKVVLGKLRPNSVTIASVLPACASVELGGQVHCWATKLGVESDIYVATAMVTMYSNCGELVSAKKVFDRILNKNVVSYNAFISGILQNGVPHLVFDAFKDLLESSDEVPNSVTLVLILSACSKLLYIRFGRQIHGLLVKIEINFDAMVGTALVDMYSKCGSWHWAYDIFTELRGSRNLVTWNSMIAGLMLNGQSDIAVELFQQLESEGLVPDSATWNTMISGFSQLGLGFEAFKFFHKMQSTGVVASLKSITSLLRACSACSALQSGKEIHGHAIRINISTDEFISTALIDMYMKCGHSYLAKRVFCEFQIKPKDPAFWNAMISGYGRNGEYQSAFEIFNQMQEEKVPPNSATLVSILSVCSHTGEVDRGWQLFKMINRDYGLNPTSEHFGCMVDLLGRSGRIKEAQELIHEMPEASVSVFASLLGACRNHLDSALGEEMAKRLSELEPQDPTPFVILSNIYAVQGRWGDVERVREMMNDRGLKKLPGCSLIRVT